MFKIIHFIYLKILQYFHLLIFNQYIISSQFKLPNDKLEFLSFIYITITIKLATALKTIIKIINNAASFAASILNLLFYRLIKLYNFNFLIFLYINAIIYKCFILFNIFYQLLISYELF